MRSNARRTGASYRSGVSSSVGNLPVPNPRTWPKEIREWFRSTIGEAGPLDVFVFDYGQIACLYLQDAITAAAVLPIAPSEWHTEHGYPIFCFESERMPDIQKQLCVVGYEVHVLAPAQRHQPTQQSQAKVINIASIRKREKASC